MVRVSLSICSLYSERGRAHVAAPTLMPHLRIICDDIGLSPRQNEHVFAMAREGHFTGASLLTNYAPAEEACKQLRSIGLKDIGVHLNLSDGFPLTPLPRGVALVNRQGQFRDRIRLYWLGWRIGARLRQQIRNELAAQIERFCEWGAPPTHLSSHCHFHTLPPFSALLRELAQEYGIARIRAPHLRANLSPIMQHHLRRLARGVIIDGQRQYLALVEQWLSHSPRALVAAIARCSGDVELVVHPGRAPDADFPDGFQYSPSKRERESAYLRRFFVSFKADPRGIVLDAPN